MLSLLYCICKFNIFVKFSENKLLNIENLIHILYTYVQYLSKLISAFRFSKDNKRN